MKVNASSIYRITDSFCCMTSKQRFLTFVHTRAWAKVNYSVSSITYYISFDWYKSVLSAAMGLLIDKHWEHRIFHRQWRTMHLNAHTWVLRTFHIPDINDIAIWPGENGRVDALGGMSPSISQIWDFETLSRSSQPPTLDDLIEELAKKFWLTQCCTACTAWCSGIGEYPSRIDSHLYSIQPDDYHLRAWRLGYSLERFKNRTDRITYVITLAHKPAKCTSRGTEVVCRLCLCICHFHNCHKIFKSWIFVHLPIP